LIRLLTFHSSPSPRFYRLQISTTYLFLHLKISFSNRKLLQFSIITRKETEIYKNLDRYKSENFVGLWKWLYKTLNHNERRYKKYFSSLSILHDYFDSPTELFSDLSKFLNNSAKSVALYYYNVK